ncbi:hypothetical protein ACFODQ_05290 [Comamonas sp. JC664]
MSPGRVGAAQRLNTPNFMGFSVSNAATINGCSACAQSGRRSTTAGTSGC